MAKDWEDRLKDTVSYIEAKAPDTAAEVKKEMKAQFKNDKEQEALSNALSINHKDPRNKEARRAKRALMLATKLFLDDKKRQEAELKRLVDLPEDKEDGLLAEYLSWFPKDKVKPKDVAKLAVDNIGKMPKWNNLQVKAARMIRGEYDKTHDFNCYNAVVFWAFQAGAISRRFLFNKWEGLDGQQAFPIFSKCGWTTVLKWESKKDQAPKLVQGDAEGEIDVPVGHAVYFVTPHKVFGHVGMSIGKGEIISQNSITAPAKIELINPKYKKALGELQKAVTHVISIRNFIDIHYHPENGYFALQYTTTPFWEAYPLNER
jgi:hypothetical protein